MHAKTKSKTKHATLTPRVILTALSAVGAILGLMLAVKFIKAH